MYLSVVFVLPEFVRGKNLLFLPSNNSGRKRVLSIAWHEINSESTGPRTSVCVCPLIAYIKENMIP